ncbi:uncharacterized protein LOC141665964 [Apium graveolens]|uniref:uncharacterized protein LOC141665964 n=1 Tax=Apium graveolens TaxID=4045 RepID=UPI003D792DDC
MTKICGHLWLNDDTNLYITSDVQGLDQATIASLLTMEGHQLDVEIIEDLFNQRDQLCIAHSPVGGENEEDGLFWSEDRTREYTVKSAYRLLQKHKGAWVTDDNSRLWTRTLSTKKTVLNAKQVSISVMCLICNGEVETILHAIVSCLFATQCWRSRERVFQVTEDYNFDRWNIWQATNNMLWNQKKSEVWGVVNSAKRCLADWRKAQVMSTKALYQDIEHGDGAISWVKSQID